MKSVQRRQQLTHLGGHRAGDRAEVGRLAATDQSLDRGQWRQRTAHAEPDQPAGDHRQEQHGQEGVGEDLAGERSTLVARVGHDDRDPAPAGHGDEAPEYGGPQRCVAIADVAEPRGGGLRRWKRRREIGVAGDQGAVRAGYAIKDPVAAAGGEDRQGGVGQVDRDLAVVELQRVGDAQGGGEQELVEGAVGRAARIGGEREV